MTSPADPIKAATSNHACCQVSAAKPAESITVPKPPTGVEFVTLPTTNTLRSAVPVARALHEPLDWATLSPGALSLAVLCTFLV